LSEEEAVVGHAERWEAVVVVEQKKSSLSRKVAAVIEGGEEEAVIDIPRGRPSAPHHRERELAARFAVFDLGEDAWEASGHGRRSRTLGSGWLVAPPPCLAHFAAGMSMTPPRRALLEPRHCASLAPPQRRRLAHVAVGMNMMLSCHVSLTPPPCLARTVAMVMARVVVVVTTTERDTPAACSRPPPPP
jgi:hypothetical protein